MKESGPSSLPYESARDFRRRRRWLILTDAHWEGIRFAVLMLALILMLALALIFDSLILLIQRGTLPWLRKRPA